MSALPFPPFNMPADAMKSALTFNEMTQAEMATALDLDERTVRRYCNNECEIPQTVAMAVMFMATVKIIGPETLKGALEIYSNGQK